MRKDMLDRPGTQALGSAEHGIQFETRRSQQDQKFAGRLVADAVNGAEEKVVGGKLPRVEHLVPVAVSIAAHLVGVVTGRNFLFGIRSSSNCRATSRPIASYVARSASVGAWCRLPQKSHQTVRQRSR